MLKNTFCTILKVLEKKVEADDPELPETSLTKWDFEYGVQYFNKFKKLGYRINELTYHIFEHEVISTLCPPSEKKTDIRGYWKLVKFCIFEELCKWRYVCYVFSRLIFK